jgi:hypothetical protein
VGYSAQTSGDARQYPRINRCAKIEPISIQIARLNGFIVAVVRFVAVYVCRRMLYGLRVVNILHKFGFNNVCSVLWFAVGFCSINIGRSER